MNAAIVLVLDKELPHLRGIERDELAAKIAAAVAAQQHGCPHCRTDKKKRGRR